MNKILSLNKTKEQSGSNSNIFNKLTKRYSNVSSKLMRKSPGRKNSPQPTSTGSYDMTGLDYEDLKPEIGAPVLISKTIIDADYHLDAPQPERAERTNSYTSDSDNDVYADAASSIQNFGDIKFCFFPDHPKEEDEEKEEPTEEPYSQPIPIPRTSTLKKAHSKSATNLHKTELSITLQKAPSLDVELNQKFIEECYDIPKNNSLSDDDDKSHDSNKLSCKHAKSLESVNTSTTITPHINCSNTSLNKSVINNNNDLHCQSKESIQSDVSSLEDFDLKSASFTSLDHKSLFLSIEELDAITKQINESEEFNNDIDLSYCEHRDNLRPSERRITLLRNKNTNKINFTEKKEKISNAWSGIKNWIGEEKVKIKDVVNRHAALQRVGTSNQSFTKNQAFFDKMKIQNVKKIKNRECAIATDEISHQSSVSQSYNMGRGYEQKNGDDTDCDAESIISEVKSIKNVNGLGESGGSNTASSNLRGSSEDRDTLPAATQPFYKKLKNLEILEGQNGFEELRRYVKQGGDFGKDLVTILQERIDAEQLYSKSLSKMASKLNKACREIPGSIADAWRGVATEMESRSEVHRLFSNSLTEEIVKPLKNILDNQHKTRKAIESTVDKSARILTEWRVSEAKSKKSSHTAARENEKLQDAMLDVRITRSPSIAILHTGHHKTPEKESKTAEKDSSKLDNKRKKAEDSVKKADVEYYTLCVRSERARVDWEMSVLRGSTVLQSLENQRLTNLKNYVTSYLKLSSDMNPINEQIIERLAPQVNVCNIQKDMIVVRNIRRASEGPSEQLLPDFYCEHTTLAMNRERRKQALVKLLQLVRQDLERERRSRNGLNGLSQSLVGTDNQNITDRLYHIRSMLTYLEGARYKLQSALFELDHKQRGSHPLAAHIQITRDRTGLQQSILKVPLWLKNNEDTSNQQDTSENDDLPEIEDPGTENCVDIKNETLIKQFARSFTRSKSNLDFSNGKPEVKQNGKSNTLSDRSNSPAWDRGIADGVSNQPDSDFDEFSSNDEDEEVSSKKEVKPQEIPPPPVVIGRCKAIYSYTPKLYDELELNPGDVIEIHAKQEDGWWLGALKTQIGIFPATYVEEI